MEFVDRGGLFTSESWKVKAKDLRAFAELKAGKLLPGKIDPKTEWQLVVIVNGINESRALTDSNGRIPKDTVSRSLDFTYSLRPTVLKQDKAKGRERIIRHEHHKNYEILFSYKDTVKEALSAGLEILAFQCALGAMSDETLVTALETPNIEYRPYVISEIRQRKLRSAVGPLIELLKESGLDQESELETIGALIGIGDERAVGPLIDSARRRPSVYLTQIIFGVAELGGKQAEAYLFTLKAGHTSKSIRKHAEDALSELHRRKGKRDE